MKPQVDEKWRKKSPNQHKRYGEKRNRDYKREISDYFTALSLKGDNE